MWVERAAMLSDKLDSLLMQHGEVASNLAMEIGGSRDPQYHNVDLGSDEPPFSDSSTDEQFETTSSSDFELQRNETVFDKSETAAPVEGLVNESALFEEIETPSQETELDEVLEEDVDEQPSAEEPAQEMDSSEMFEEIHPAETVVDTADAMDVTHETSRDELGDEFLTRSFIVVRGIRRSCR